MTFIWDSEASVKAQVHCVIIGFGKSCHKVKKLFANGRMQLVNNINGYLCDADDVFITKRLNPIDNVPTICLGGQPLDDGNLILTEEERIELLNKNPLIEKYIRPFMMGKDFIDRKPRYCLWLQGINPSELRKCPEILSRIKLVEEFRLKSNRESTLRAAQYPSLFGAPFECMSDYIAIPKVSSQNRRYIPMDYISKEIIPGDKLFTMQDANLFHFGVMMSNIHMAWTRAVCGRLKSDYSYSNTIEYNNFPWPSSTPEQKAKIEKTAQGILDARALYPDASLADLYDELTMPPELRKAHQLNDLAVMQAYGFTRGTEAYSSEAACVAELMRMYQKKVKESM